MTKEPQTTNFSNLTGDEKAFALCEIAFMDCELLGIDPATKTPDGPFIKTAIKSVAHTMNALAACGYKIERVKQ